jgi:hypothetical protein
VANIANAAIFVLTLFVIFFLLRAYFGILSHVTISGYARCISTTLATFLNLPVQAHGVKEEESAPWKRDYAIMATFPPMTGTPTPLLIIPGRRPMSLVIVVFTPLTSAHPLLVGRPTSCDSIHGTFGKGLQKLSNLFECLADNLDNRHDNLS